MARVVSPISVPAHTASEMMATFSAPKVATPNARSSACASVSVSAWKHAADQGATRKPNAATSRARVSARSAGPCHRSDSLCADSVTRARNTSGSAARAASSNQAQAPQVMPDTIRSSMWASSPSGWARVARGGGGASGSGRCAPGAAVRRR